jgi:hypothetical protein
MKETLSICKTDQKRPLILPSAEISIFSADGFAGSPGIRIIVPAIGTIKPAPEESSISLILIVNP